MKTLLMYFQIVLLMCGVFDADADEVKSVMEGDSVTLNPDLSQIQGFIEILWRFGEKGSTIAQTDGNKTSYEDYEVFRGRLQLSQTGSLTITNTRTNHSGLYEAEINHKTGTSNQKFSITVYESPPGIAGAEAEMKSMSVKEGVPVTLHVPQIQGDELIVWRFGDEEKLIAKADLETKSSSLYYNEERFRDRLKLDQTGSLTITNTRTTDSGEYKVKISSNKQILYKRFIVTVSDSGYSGGAVAGIVVVGVLLLAAAAAGVIYFYRRPRTTNLPSQTLTVMVGDYVTLNRDTEIQRGDEIQWLFGAGDSLIAEIKGENREMKTYKGPDEIFMNRLKQGETTGSLIIKVIGTKHNGLYTLKIRRGRETIYSRFHVSVQEREITVMVGDNVSLKPATEIQTGDEIQWLFGAEDTLIAEIKGENREMKTYKGPDEIFMNRLKQGETTGSLTIKFINSEHAGLYTLKIRRGRETFYNRFYVSVVEREISVMVGDPVTLEPDTKIQTGDEVQWLFEDGDLDTDILAEIKGENREKKTYGTDGRFRDRLKLDEMTGSLTITNTRTDHTGCYTLEIRRGRETIYKRFHVSVGERVVVTKAKSVTLKPNNEIDEEIQWLFGDEDLQTLIAELNGKTGEILTHDDVVDGIFRGRLELDKTTGSLTINNTTTEHSGLYKLEIRFRDVVLKQKFIVTVKDDTEKRENESAAVVMEKDPLLDGDYVNVVNEEEGTSSL